MPDVKVLITGAKGQMGSELMSALQHMSGMKVYGFGRDELDVTDFTQVKQVLFEIRPDIIIHTAAYTSVDSAEDEPERAYLVNGTGTRNIAIAAAKLHAKLVYISTDYVFNGEHREPISELEKPCPLGVYGKTKLAGEEFVRDFHNRFFIVRTSWIYGEHGRNFVQTMLCLAEGPDDVHVVDDQIGSPTYARDLAHCIARLMMSDKYGIYHVSNIGSCSWYEFAQAVFAEAGIMMKVSPCKTSDFPRKAPRPYYSALQHMALGANGFPPMRHWREALSEFVELSRYTDVQQEKQA